MTCAGILLTGGASRRMGRDKAAICVGNVSLAERTGALLAAVCTPSVEVGRAVSALPSVPERRPGDGPLAAIADARSALVSMGFEGPAVVLATDMPRLTVGLVAWLAGYPGGCSVVPVSGQRPQPLCARWSATDLAGAVGLVAAGRRSMRDLLESGDVVLAGPESWVTPAGGSDVITDVDTPADLTRLGIGTAG